MRTRPALVIAGLAVALAATGAAGAGDREEVSAGGRRFVRARAEFALIDGRRVRAAGPRAPGAVPVWYPSGVPRTPGARRFGTNHVVVRADAEPHASVPGLLRLEPFPAAPDTYIATIAGALEAPRVARALAALPGVRTAYPVLAWMPHLRSLPDDPLFADQWHLRNTQQRGGKADVDLNADGAWEQGFTGSGVRISVVDDGLQHEHEDLRDNYVASTSTDRCDGDADPAPGLQDSHGTSVSGGAAARGNNGIGVTGVAYTAEISGQRTIACGVSDGPVALALGSFDDELDVSTNSWGPSDNGAVLEAPGELTLTAIEENVAGGRGGLGTIYTWANGNGRGSGDDGNYDGYTNLRTMISVGAVASNGETAPYAETCACMLVTAPSAGNGDSLTVQLGIGKGTGITTTDRLEPALGYAPLSPYTNTFGGTSAATPLVAGVVALILEANPALGWRDVQAILATTARTDVLGDTVWQVNGAGHLVSHDFGFGLADAAAAVEAALSWTPLGPELTTAATDAAPFELPDGLGSFPAYGDPVERAVTLPADIVIEHVTVTFSAELGRTGDLRLKLTSPAGTESILWPGRDGDDGNDLQGYDSWTASSTQFLGERSAGTWTLEARDMEELAASAVTTFTVTAYGHAR